jgi:hypothetical protein
MPPDGIFATLWPLWLSIGIFAVAGLVAWLGRDDEEDA